MRCLKILSLRLQEAITRPYRGGLIIFGPASQCISGLSICICFRLILHSQVEEQPVGEASIGVLIEQLRVDHNFFMTELAGAVKTMRRNTAECY